MDCVGTETVTGLLLKTYHTHRPSRLRCLGGTGTWPGGAGKKRGAGKFTARRKIMVGRRSGFLLGFGDFSGDYLKLQGCSIFFLGGEMHDL